MNKLIIKINKDGFPDFQRLLDQFEGELKFNCLVGKLEVSPDEFIYTIETDQGIYYIFETDDISDSEGMSGFDYIIKQIKDRTESFSSFVEAKHPLEKGTIAEKYGYLSPDDYPSDYEQFKKYLSIGYGSFIGYFTFLIKK